MSFYSDQAAQFEQIAQTLQTRLHNEGATMDNTTYNGLQAQRDALLDQASAMIADDIQVTLAQLKVNQPRLAAGTVSLNNAVKTVQMFDKVAAVAAAAVTLATAIASANPGSIATAIVGAEKAVQSAVSKTPVVAIAQPAAGLAIAASTDSAEPQS